MKNEEELEYNFWPAFTDLMLTLILILILVIFLIISVIKVGNINLSVVQKNQKEIIHDIAASFGGSSREIEKNNFAISITNAANGDIIINNEPMLQQITFSSQILFPPDDYTLNENGREVLLKVGNILREKLPLIREIQIQGHADNVVTHIFPSNVHLAAYRAIEVFKFFQDEIGIDPSRNLMSITSFGEFKPVNRSTNDIGYSQERLINDNAGEIRNQNRRIEILLFYRH